MRPLQWYFDYEPKGYQPRKDRRLQNHQARQQARREITDEVEALARECRALDDPETLAIFAEIMESGEEFCARSSEPVEGASWWRRLFCALGGHGTIHSGYARQRWRPSCLRCGARFSQTHGVSI